MRTTQLTLGALAAAVAWGGEPTTPTDSSTAESAAESESIALELYSPPRSISKATPSYPRTALRNNKEGWVRLDFMVDPKGDPYEIVVTESVGDEVFHDAAIRALEKSRFEPARFEGKPLDAGHHLYYKLRCARKYVFLRFDPDLQYKIEPEYLPCHLQLVGDPGTTFTLTQL